MEPADRDEVMGKLHAIIGRSFIPGTKATLTIRGEFLPLTQTPAATKLFEMYRAAAGESGLSITGEFSGGCADSGFTAGGRRADHLRGRPGRRQGAQPGGIPRGCLPGAAGPGHGAGYPAAGPGGVVGHPPHRTAPPRCAGGARVPVLPQRSRPGSEMQFAYFNLMSMNHPGETPAQVLTNTVRQVRLAEELGFDATWFAEHHFSNASVCASPLMMAMHCAAVTSRILLGPAVVVLPLHHPLRVAQEVAMLDQISGGRVLLGFGPGHQPHEFRSLQVPLDSAMPGCWKAGTSSSRR